MSTIGNEDVGGRRRRMKKIFIRTYRKEDDKNHKMSY
jgi:hypothetical protein